MIPFLIAGLDGRPEMWSGNGPPVLLGRSFFRRAVSGVKKAATTAINPVAQAASAVHTTARVTRALAKPVQDLAHGKVSKAFIDSGTALTRVVEAPITTAANSIGQTGVESALDRNDPIAALNRVTLEVLKRVARPIVKSFAGFGDDDDPQTLGAKLRAQKTKIIAAVTAPGVAAATASGGPYAGAAAGALIPVAVDAVIDEIVSAGRNALSSGGGSGDVSPTAAVDTKNQALTRKYLPVIVIGGGAAVGGFIWWRRRRRKKRG